MAAEAAAFLRMGMVSPPTADKPLVLKCREYCLFFQCREWNIWFAHMALAVKLPATVNICFCSATQMASSLATRFLSSNITHKKTWCTPNGLISNKIDYICISSHGRSVLQDMRVYRSADFGSDHHHLKAVLRLRLKIQQAPKPKSPFDLNKLKNVAVNHQYQQWLADVLQNPENGTVEDQWSLFKHGDILCRSDSRQLGEGEHNMNAGSRKIPQNRLINVINRMPKQGFIN